MAGQNRLRGKEARIRITKDGTPLGGDFLLFQNWSVTTDSTIVKTMFTGEKRARLDQDIQGYDFSGDLHIATGEYVEAMADVDRREQAGLPNPEYQVTLLLNYRERGVALQKVALSGEVVVKFGEVTASGSDHVTVRIEGAGQGMAVT